MDKKRSRILTPPPRPSRDARDAAETGVAPEAARHSRYVLRDANEQLVLTALRMQQEAEQDAMNARALLEGLGEVVTRFDRELRHVYVNRAIEESTGRARWEFLGKTHEELGMSAELVAQWREILLEGFRTGHPAETLFTYDSPEGARIFHARTLPERSSEGNVESVVTIARDVTDSRMYRRAREDADRLRRIHEATAAFSEATTPEQIAEVLLDHGRGALGADAGMVARLDDGDAMLRLIASDGWAEPERVRWRVLDLADAGPLTDAVRERTALYLESIDDALARYPQLVGVRGAGQNALIAIPLRIGARAIGGLVLTFFAPRRFTSNDREFMSVLAVHAAQALERARLYEAERTARREAEDANRLKDEFLATMSHELRTPLSAVMGWTAILRDDPSNPELVRRGLEAIDRSARTQARLVDDVLDVSRIVTGKLRLRFERTDVAEVVRTAVESIRPAACAKHVALDLTLRAVPEIWADPMRLQQVVSNLLVNAVKFTPEGGSITTSLEPAGDRIRIEVTDTGIGIPAEFVPHVYDSFRQLDGSSTRQYGGLGLGLAIVRHIVESHGGSVDARSPGCGRGATFTVEIPIATGDERPARTTVRGPTHPVGERGAVADAPLRGVRVLVVDDDEDSREIVALMLRAHGARPEFAASAEEALAKIRELPPDILVCDIAMPGTDGYALMEAIRAMPPERGGSVPAIAATGFARQEDKDRALRVGFQAHINKPIELEALARLIARLVPIAPDVPVVSDVPVVAPDAARTRLAHDEGGASE